MYASGNPRTKAELKRRVASGEQVTAFYPGIDGGHHTGRVSIEGPHYPEPHRWYARVEIRDGVIVKVLS